MESNANLAVTAKWMSTEAKPNGGKPNGALALLTTLAQSGHAWVQFGTLALIALSGIGNWVATWNSADRNKEEIEVSRRVAWEGEQRIKQELVKQVAEIHAWMHDATDEFHRGNADSAANRKTLNQVVREDLEGFETRQQAALDNQNKIMKSQSQILENDTVLIREIHQIVENLNQWKKNEQMRGAPP